MTILDQNNSILLIIDIQEKLLNATFNKEIIEKKSEILTRGASLLNIPIYITEQYPKGLGGTICSIKNNINNNASIFEKITFSAIDIEELKLRLSAENRKQIVLCGIETHICVSQTANALIESGYEVKIISDACGSRCESEHNAGINLIHNRGAEIMTTEIALFEWLRSAKHIAFKEIQALIK